MSPPLAVLATLVLILLVPRRVPMWASFLAACLLLPLLCGKGIGESAKLWRDAAADGETWVFVGLCAGVFVLSSILTHGGHLAAMCDFASALIPSRRVRAAFMPALVGLVPMPGGAAVSAPLLDRSLGAAEVSATDRNLINYWFRHIWEVSWPLYPAVLLAVGFLARGEERFFLAQASLTIVLAVSGYVALLRRIPKGQGDGRGPMPALATSRAVLPILALIALPLACSGGRGFMSGPLGNTLLAVGVAIVLAVATAIRPAGLKEVPFDRRIYSMTALAYLIQVFGSLVKATGASDVTARALGQAGWPVWAGVLLVPYLIGFATGNTQTFVTMAFPVVVPYLKDETSVPWLVLGYAGGFLGYLTSPVHMCLVLSTRYFNSKLLSAYARLTAPLLVFLGAAIGLFLILGGRFDL